MGALHLKPVLVAVIVLMSVSSLQIEGTTTECGGAQVLVKVSPPECKTDH